MNKRKRVSSSSTATNGDDEEKSGRMMKKRMKIHKSRTDCLKKKTYELSVLCGVDVALLSFAPDGSLLSSWPENQTEIVSVIQRYKHTDLKKKLKPSKKKKLGLSNNNSVTRDFGKSCDFSLNNPETTNEQVEEVCGLVSQYQLLDSKEKEIETLLQQRCFNNQGLNGGTKNQDDFDDLVAILFEEEEEEEGNVHNCDEVIHELEDDVHNNRDHQQSSSFSLNGGNLDCGLLSSSSIDEKWMRSQERGSTRFDPITIGDDEDDYEFASDDQQVDFVNGDDEIIIISEWEDEFLQSYFSGLI